MQIKTFIASLRPAGPAMAPMASRFRRPRAGVLWICVIAACIPFAGCERLHKVVASTQNAIAKLPNAAPTRSTAENPAAAPAPVPPAGSTANPAVSAAATFGTGAFAENQIHEINSTGFDSFIQQRDKLVLVEFYADWCGACRALWPVVARVAPEFPGTVVVARINVDGAQPLATKLGARLIPDLRFYRDGVQVDQSVGAIDDAHLRSLIRSHVNGLTVPSPAAVAAQPAPQPSADKPTGHIERMKKNWMPPGIQRR